MKFIVNGKTFAMRGYQPSEYYPENGRDWDADFESASALPDNVDLRAYMTPVEDQSSIGSCTANAVAGAYEYLCNRRSIATGDEVGDISRLFIYYVARKRDQEKRGTSHLQVQDSGSTISGAIDALNKKGACLEETLPYDIQQVNVPPTEDMYDEARAYKIAGAYRVPTDVNAFKDILAKGFPIIFGCKLFKSFHIESGRGIRGIIPMPSGDEEQSDQHGLHAMLIVGYYDSHDVFVVRNSWGDSWGHDGYCFMPYAYVGSNSYNMDDNWVVQSLTEYDLTPDNDDDSCGVAFFSSEEHSSLPEIKVLDEDPDEAEEEEDEFDVDEYFSDLAEATKVFNAFDADGSGGIALEELPDALKFCGKFVSDDQERSIMEMVDEDGSGTITFEEFLDFLGIAGPESSNDEDDEDNQRKADEHDVFRAGGCGYPSSGGLGIQGLRKEYLNGEQKESEETSADTNSEAENGNLPDGENDNLVSEDGHQQFKEGDEGVGVDPAPTEDSEEGNDEDDEDDEDDYEDEDDDEGGFGMGSMFVGLAMTEATKMVTGFARGAMRNKMRPSKKS